MLYGAWGVLCCPVPDILSGNGHSKVLRDLSSAVVVDWLEQNTLVALIGLTVIIGALPDRQGNAIFDRECGASATLAGAIMSAIATDGACSGNSKLRIKGKGFVVHVPTITHRVANLYSIRANASAPA